MLARVILVLGDSDLLRSLREMLRAEDCVVESVRGRRNLWKRLSQSPGDLLVLDRGLLPERAWETVRQLTSAPEEPLVVVVSEREDGEDRARLLGAGCKAVLDAALPRTMLRDVFRNLLSERTEMMSARIAALRPGGPPRLSDFVSTSAAMQTFLRVVERVADSDSSLLIQGETGVGKERLARAIHAEGRRSQGPFVAVNCGALPESLLESELFGHEEGAFTGATRLRRGWFELAHGGTVFLDEIGELALHLQVKLLRVLQEREVQRIGGEKSLTVDVRIMAATNRDIRSEVEHRRFRSDLYYRLSVVTLTLPPLRERREDIPPLVENYIDYFQSVIGREVSGLDGDALQALCTYDWPGNVRELANVIERAVLLADGACLSLSDLPDEMRAPGDGRGGAGAPAADASSPFDPSWTARPLAELRDEVVRRLEGDYFRALLAETGGRVGETARRAGITPRSLFSKMKSLGLRKEEFREP